jgi:hypothetical protein
VAQRPGHPEAIGREPAWRIYMRTAWAAAVICHHGEDGDVKNPTAKPGGCSSSDYSLDEFIAGWTLSLDISQWIRGQTEHAAN